MTEKYLDRINYGGSLDEVFYSIAQSFGLGKVVGFNIIPVGYEDANFKLTADSGSFFVKIFASTRDQQDINRYSESISAAIEAGVRHPQLLKHSDGQTLYKHEPTSLQLLVMEWVDGQSFWDIKRNPTSVERSKIIEAAVSLNSSTYKPPYAYDSWALTNFEREFKEFSSTLLKTDGQKIKAVLDEFKQIDIEGLPYAFVHGDLISTNVLVSEGGLYFIDLSVANYYPRIVELAVLLSNLLFDAESAKDSKKMYEETVAQYSGKLSLSEQERSALGVFTKAAHCMHIIGASKAMSRNEDDDENQYWLEQGRIGLTFDFY